MYKVILFDLDNTLLLPETSLTEKLTELTVSGEYVFSTESARMAQREAELWTARQILHEIETNTRMDDDLFLENVLTCYRERATIKNKDTFALIYDAVTDRAKSAPTSEVFDLLGILKEEYKLGIVSNNSARIRSLLDEYQLTPYFEVITISAEVGIEKPDPRIMLETCAEFQEEPKDCLYVGDHPFDVLCAERAGMDCVWVDRGVFEESDLPAKPQYIIKQIADLKLVL